MIYDDPRPGDHVLIQQVLGVVDRMTRAAAHQSPVTSDQGHQLMTFSIIARDPASAAFGVAVSTAVPCVGAAVPFAKSGVGAISTQSHTNIELGREGLKLLELGLSPRAALEGMLADDSGRESPSGRRHRRARPHVRVHGC